MASQLRNLFEVFRSELKKYAPGHWNPIAVREAHALFTFVLTLPISVFYFIRIMHNAPFYEYGFISRMIQYFNLFIYFSAIALLRLLIGIAMRTSTLPPNLVIDYADETPADGAGGVPRDDSTGNVAPKTPKNAEKPSGRADDLNSPSKMPATSPGKVDKSKSDSGKARVAPSKKSL